MAGRDFVSVYRDTVFVGYTVPTMYTNPNPNIATLGGLAISEDNYACVCVPTDHTPEWVREATIDALTNSGYYSLANPGAYSLKVGNTPVPLTLQQGIFRSKGYVPTRCKKFRKELIFRGTYNIQQRQSSLTLTDYSFYTNRPTGAYNTVVLYILNSTDTTNVLPVKVKTVRESNGTYTATVTRADGSYFNAGDFVRIYSQIVYLEEGEYPIKYYDHKTSPMYSYKAKYEDIGEPLVINNTTITSGYERKSSGDLTLPDSILYDSGGSSVINQSGGFLVPTDKPLECDMLFRRGVPVDESVFRWLGGYI